MKCYSSLVTKNLQSIVFNFRRNFCRNVHIKQKWDMQIILKQPNNLCNKKMEQDKTDDVSSGCSGGSGSTTDKGQNRSKDCSKRNAQSVCSQCDSGDAKSKSDENSTKSKTIQKDIKKQTVTLIPGDGIGPEICAAVEKIFNVAQVPIEWERIEGSLIIDDKGTAHLPEGTIASLMKNKIGLKGPVQSGLYTWTKLLRRQFGLYAHVAVCRSLGAYRTHYKPIDCVIIRDCTEGEYSGIEHEVARGIIQGIKVGTATAACRLAEFVFEYATKHSRAKVTLAHKANIQQLTDGIFLKSMRSIAENYRDKFIFEERYLDTVCHRIITEPEHADIIVASSMYGDVMTTLAANIAGGLTMCASFNVGSNGIIYDVSHQSANNIVAQDMANPTAILLSAVLMLRDMQLHDYANKIEDALTKIYCEKKVLTADLGGCAKTSEFIDAMCETICNSEN